MFLISNWPPNSLVDAAIYQPDIIPDENGNSDFVQ